MNRGSCEFSVTEDDITAGRRLDTMSMSDCHSSTMKNGDKAEISCPDAIILLLNIPLGQ